MTQLSLYVILKFHVAYVKEDIFGRTMYSLSLVIIAFKHSGSFEEKGESPHPS